METARTTLRIRKDLLKAAKRLALEKETSLQDVINNIMEKGMRTITNVKTRKRAFNAIDKFRKETEKYNIRASDIVKKSKKQLR